MSEPLRTDPADLRARPSGGLSSGGLEGPLSEADRAARIEELLLSGLDQYFVGHYEQAINIWTRVAFLERGHGRARAYIERARDALAEKQRQSEELLHGGIAAYHAGDLDKARDLLMSAIDQGGPNETALLFLQRISRASSALEPRPPERPSARRRRGAVRDSDATSTRSGWVVSIAAAIGVSGVIVLGALGVRSWIVELPVAGRTSEVVGGEPLPLVRGSEMRLARARELNARGLPHDALRLLAQVDVADPLRDEADRLTADIQRGLLATASQDTTAASATSRTPVDKR
jgi:tetratricopeptide (TPR) repeat protein